MPRKSLKLSRNDRQQTLLDHFAPSSSPARPLVKKKSTPLARGLPRGAFAGNKTTATANARDNDHDLTSTSDSGVEKIQFEPEALEVSDEEEEIQYAKKSGRSARRVRVESDAESSTSGNEAGVEGELVGARWPTGTRRKRNQILDSDSPSAEESSQKKRKLWKSKRLLSEEDEVDIMDEIDEKVIIQSRLRQRSKRMSAFEKNLERLTRKKRGQAMTESEEDDDDEDHYFSSPKLFAGARPDNDGDRSEPDEASVVGEDEDDFIVDDEIDAAQGPALPVAFSMSTHQDMSHHFKIICQLFVHLAVTSPDQRCRVMNCLSENEYFSVPLHIARRKLSGIRDSVASSVWRPDFKKALQTFPDFHLASLEFSLPHCDACHLGGRLSTIMGRLEGNPYHKLTFEISINSNSDPGSDEDEGDDKEIKREFNLGRFCSKRTQIFHQLTHWEYTLYQALTEEVCNLEFDDAPRVFIRVAFAGGIEPPSDITNADQIMEWLDQRGVITCEWIKVKELMTKAMNLEIDAKRGEEFD